MLRNVDHTHYMFTDQPAVDHGKVDHDLAILEDYAQGCKIPEYLLLKKEACKLSTNTETHMSLMNHVLNHGEHVPEFAAVLRDDLALWHLHQIEGLDDAALAAEFEENQDLPRVRRNLLWVMEDRWEDRDPDGFDAAVETCGDIEDDAEANERWGHVVLKKFMA